MDVSAFPRIGVYLDGSNLGSPPDLGDLVVSENGVSRPVVGRIEPPAPLNLVVLVDSAALSEAVSARLSAALEELRGALDRRDRVTCLVSSNVSDGVPGFSRERASLRQIPVDTVGPSRLNDALAAAFEACVSEPGRCAILLLAAGRDQGSYLAPRSLMQMAVRASAPLYVALLDASVDRALWAELAGACGGRIMDGATPEQARAAVAGVLEFLHGLVGLQYETVRPVQDGLWREVIVGHLGRLPVAMRPTGYFAPSAPEGTRWITFRLEAPSGEDWPVPVLLTGRAGRFAAVGVSGTAMRLPAGQYTARVLTNPPSRDLPVVVTSGEDATVGLGAIGFLRVIKPVLFENPFAFSLASEETGEVVATGESPFPIPLVAGRYAVQGLEEAAFFQSAVEIAPASTTAMDLSSLGQLTVALQGVDGSPFGVPLEVLEGSEGPVKLRGTTHAPIFLPAGSYAVRIGTEPPVTLSSLVVPPSQAVTAEAGRLGSLLVRLADPSGEGVAVPWALYDEEDRLAGTATTGMPEPVAPGQFRLHLLTRPSRDFAVRVAPGEQAQLDAGSLAAAFVSLADPGGEALSIPFALLEPGTERAVASGLTGDENLFMPGEYDLEVWTRPPLRLKGIRLAAGAPWRADLGRLGGLMVRGARAGSDLGRYAVEDSQGRIVGVFNSGEVALLQPGEYRVISLVGGTAAGTRVTLEAGRIVRLDLSLTN